MSLKQLVITYDEQSMIIQQITGPLKSPVIFDGLCTRAIDVRNKWEEDQLKNKPRIVQADGPLPPFPHGNNGG